MKRAQWDKLAHKFEAEICDITREETRDQLARFVDAVRLPAKNAVLVDLGCGLGTFVKKYGKRFARITAVEFAPKIIARARKRCADVAGVRWLTMDVARSAKKVGRIADLTVCMNVITSPREAIREAQWKSIATVTKSKGFALIVVPSLESDRMVERVAYGEKNAAVGGLVERGDSYQKHFTRAELEPILASHGFAATRIGRIYYPWSKEGLRKPRGYAGKGPWDWVILARRRAAR